MNWFDMMEENMTKGRPKKSPDKVQKRIPFALPVDLYNRMESLVQADIFSSVNAAMTAFVRLGLKYKQRFKSGGKITFKTITSITGTYEGTKRVNFVVPQELLTELMDFVKANTKKTRTYWILEFIEQGIELMECQQRGDPITITEIVGGIERTTEVMIIS